MLVKSKTDLVLGIDNTHGVPVVTVAGELDANSSREFEEHLGRVAADHDVLVLDLTRVEFFDSVALASVTAVHRSTDLRLVASRQVARTVALAGMAFEIPLFPSLADALRGRAR